MKFSNNERKIPNENSYQILAIFFSEEFTKDSLKYSQIKYRSSLRDHCLKLFKAISKLLPNKFLKGFKGIMKGIPRILIKMLLKDFANKSAEFTKNITMVNKLFAEHIFKEILEEITKRIFSQLAEVHFKAFFERIAKSIFQRSSRK